MSDHCEECDRAFTTFGDGAMLRYELGIGMVCPPCRTDLMASTTCVECGATDEMAAEWGVCVACTFAEMDAPLDDVE